MNNELLNSKVVDSQTNLTIGRMAEAFEREFKRHCCHSACTEHQIAQLRFAFMSGAALLMRELFSMQSNVIVTQPDIDKVKEIAQELAKFSKEVYGPARIFNL